MRDAGIGRVLVAALHQGIADLLPTRLEFYENWFSASGLRHGTMGLAPIAAVLSFLRGEGEAYRMVTHRAGTYAGEWTVLGMNRVRRSAIRALPAGLRVRFALNVARDLVPATYAGSRARVRRRRAEAAIDIRSSIFCGVRAPVGQPLCGFYAAAVHRVLARLGVPATVSVAECRGTGHSACRLRVTLKAEAAMAEPAAELVRTSD
jgi:bacteriochlorophyll 4-vinyl reductase